MYSIVYINAMCATLSGDYSGALQRPVQHCIHNCNVYTLLYTLIYYCIHSQVTTLVHSKGPSNKKKNRSKQAYVLVAAIEAATANFISRGEEIAFQNPDIKNEMLAAVEEVRKTGECFAFSCLVSVLLFQCLVSFLASKTLMLLVSLTSRTPTLRTRCWPRWRKLGKPVSVFAF